VLDRHPATVRNDDEWIGRGVFEAHLARLADVKHAGRDIALGTDLGELAFHGGETVEVVAELLHHRELFLAQALIAGGIGARGRQEQAKHQRRAPKNLSYPTDHAPTPSLSRHTSVVASHGRDTRHIHE